MRKRNTLFTVIIFLCSFSALIICAQVELPKAGRYTIVLDESKIEIHVGTAGVFGFMGHGHTMAPKVFTGEMDLTPDAAVPATVNIRIDATSLHETANFKPEEKNTIEKQLHGEVLETAKYPEIAFQSTAVQYAESPGHVFDAKIQGDLTLHGVTKKITIPARVIDTGQKLQATGKFELNRKDYNIEPKSAAGGTVKVDKTLKVSFNLVLRSQQ